MVMYKSILFIYHNAFVWTRPPTPSSTTLTMGISECFKEIYRSISQTKCVQKESSTPLQRGLNPADLAFIGISSMLSTGVYILPGQVVGEMAAPAAVLSFIIAGLVAFPAGLCYIECAVQFPETGASYMYAYASLGEMVAFLIGWNSILFRTLGLVFVSQGWSTYFDNVIGGYIQNVTVEFVLGGNTWDMPVLASYPDFTAGVVILVACIVVSVGTDFYSRANNIFAVLNIVTVILVFIVAMIHADFSLLTKHGYFPMGFEGVMKGAVAAFIGFCGFEAIAFSAEESKDPSKGLSIGIISAFGSAILSYVAVVLSVTVLSDYQNINIKSPFVTAFGNIGLDWMKYIIAVGSLCSMTGGLLSMSYCLSRSIYPMSRDGLLPAVLSKTNEKTNTPILSTIFGTSFAICCGILLDLTSVIEISSLLILMEFVIVYFVVVILRYQQPARSGYLSLDAMNTSRAQAKHRSVENATFHNFQNVTELSESVDEIIADCGYNLDKGVSSTANDEQPTFCTVCTNILVVFRERMKRYPKSSVMISLCLHLLFESILVALLTFKMDGLRLVEGDVVFGVVITSFFTVVICCPLLVLPQYTEGLSFQVRHFVILLS